MPEAVDSEWTCFISARRGDEMAWRVLVARHRTRLTAMALFITGSDAAAEDVVQETFVRALRARLKNTSGTVRGFLGTIAYRLAVKEARRAGRSVALDGTDLPHSDRSPLENVLADERDRRVAGAITALDSEHRDALILRLYGGHTYEEIADTLGVPVGTAKSRVFYAVRSCRETLKEKGVI